MATKPAARAHRLGARHRSLWSHKAMSTSTTGAMTSYHHADRDKAVGLRICGGRPSPESPRPPVASRVRGAPNRTSVWPSRSPRPSRSLRLRFGSSGPAPTLRSHSLCRRGRGDEHRRCGRTASRPLSRRGGSNTSRTSFCWRSRRAESMPGRGGIGIGADRRGRWLHASGRDDRAQSAASPRSFPSARGRARLAARQARRRGTGRQIGRARTRLPRGQFASLSRGFGYFYGWPPIERRRQLK
jgi:hypothetical protein